MPTTLVELKHVTKRFVKELDLAAKMAKRIGVSVRREIVHAVDQVDLQVQKGEIFGLVGESGCGKSTLGRIVAGLLQPSEGSVWFDGREISGLKRREAKETALKTQMIFQDPFSSLNPRMRVREIIGEAPRVHRIVERAELDNYLDGLLLRCGLDPIYKERYPHQFSGGQRQRIAIVRALAVKPEFLVCDEVVSALDVSIQAQILNLFMDLRRDLGLTSMFISHNLEVVEHVSDKVAIMYLGRIVEQAETEELFDLPLHPYTQALLKEIPSLEKRQMDFMPIQGEVPSPLEPPSGCHFHPRCPKPGDPCRIERPVLRELRPNHFVACHNPHGMR
jgi:peptide/nickel transport system ATP-binding protein